MIFKTGITAGLLLFVAASIATPIVRHLRAARREPIADTAPVQPNAVVVYYFRANVPLRGLPHTGSLFARDCRNRFSAEAADGRIQWRAIDYQSPGNEHYVADYQLLTGGVVLVEFREGRPSAIWP